MTPPRCFDLTSRIAASLLAAGVAVPALGAVTLPHVFGNHMVLQRNMPLPVWGWAEPGETITVTLGPHRAETQADARGDWRVRLPALPAGGPHELVVSGANTLRVTDILVGEVWLCSGQSNMEMGLGVVANGAEEVAAADFPRIRLFELPQTAAGEPARDVAAEWRICRPDTVGAGNWGGFSAVAYFFGRELHRELDVPIGLIDASWGGTLIEPWTPPGGCAAVPAVAALAAEAERRDREYKERTLPASLAEIEAWVAASRAALAAGERLPDTPRWPQHPLAYPHTPTGLYNGMIHPLAPLAIRGALWYQGEANVHTDDGLLYTEKMKALIGGWRAGWGQGDFPFYYVQLAPFKYTLHNPAIRTDQMPLIWQAQLNALAIPNTGMAVTTDVGDWRDIHPADKLTVGRRLALWALTRTYGRDDVVCSGPLYRSLTVAGGKVRVTFDHVGGGLMARDGQPLSWFEVAAADGEFVAARAEIDGDVVVVWSDDVPEPAAVRYAWHMLPEPIPNLVNKAGLPASPFSTRP